MTADDNVDLAKITTAELQDAVSTALQNLNDTSSSTSLESNVCNSTIQETANPFNITWFKDDDNQICTKACLDDEIECKSCFTRQEKRILCDIPDDELEKRCKQCNGCTHCNVKQCIQRFKDNKASVNDFCSKKHMLLHGFCKNFEVEDNDI